MPIPLSDLLIAVIGLARRKGLHCFPMKNLQPCMYEVFRKFPKYFPGVFFITSDEEVYSVHVEVALGKWSECVRQRRTVHGDVLQLLLAEARIHMARLERVYGRVAIKKLESLSDCFMVHMHECSPAIAS